MTYVKATFYGLDGRKIFVKTVRRAVNRGSPGPQPDPRTVWGSGAAQSPTAGVLGAMVVYGPQPGNVPQGPTCGRGRVAWGQYRTQKARRRTGLFSWPWAETLGH